MSRSSILTCEVAVVADFSIEHLVAFLDYICPSYIKSTSGFLTLIFQKYQI